MCYKNVGRSAEWFCDAWLIRGTESNGVVVADNEDGSFSAVSFYYNYNDDSNNVHEDLFTGTFEECVDYIKDQEFVS